MSIAGWFVASILAATPIPGEVTSIAPDAVSITVYRDDAGDTLELADPDHESDGVALVTEERTVDIPAGTTRISFRGVADGMMPETASISGLPSGVAEQNFDYELLSPRSLFERSVGKTVRLVRINPTTGEATETSALIRSSANGVVLEVDGRIEPLDCSGLSEKLVFDDLPSGLSDKPSLSLLIHATAPGRYKVKLSYLSTGFDWSTDYVARIRPDGRSLDLTGWITLVNRGGGDFAKAPVAVVAGRLNRVAWNGAAYRDDDSERRPACWINGATAYPPPPFPRIDRDLLNALPQSYRRRNEETEVLELVVTGSRVDPRNLGDYKLYAVREPTHLAPYQVKQVILLQQEDVRFERVYLHEVDPYRSSDDDDDDDEGARVELRFKNDDASNLGLALPAGYFAVTEDDGRGHAVLAGDDRIADSPVGSPFDVELGTSPDVRVTTKRLSIETEGRDETWRKRLKIQAVVVNRKAAAVQFELRHFDAPAAYKVLNESRPHQLMYGRPVWRFRLKPGERQVIRYTIEES